VSLKKLKPQCNECKLFLEKFDLNKKKYPMQRTATKIKMLNILEFIIIEAVS